MNVGCVVYITIAPLQWTKTGPSRRLGIYIEYESPSITKYLESMTGDIFVILMKQFSQH